MPASDHWVAGSTLPASSPYKSLVEQLCYDSFLRHGDLQPLVIDAYWIADEPSAEYLLAFLVGYFSGQRTFVEFDTTLYAASLQLGDFITVTHPLLPSGDNGGTFETHAIRYFPLTGRMHLMASKVARIPAQFMVPAITARAQVPAPSLEMTTPVDTTEHWAYSMPDDGDLTLLFFENWS